MQRRCCFQLRHLLLDARWQRLNLNVIALHVLMLVAETQDERRLIVDGDGRTALLVVVAALPVLQVAALFVPEESKAIDHQQLAAILL